MNKKFDTLISFSLLCFIMIANIAKLYEKIQNSLLLFYINDSKDMENTSTILELTEPKAKTKGKEHSLRNIDQLKYSLLETISGSKVFE